MIVLEGYGYSNKIITEGFSHFVSSGTKTINAKSFISTGIIARSHVSTGIIATSIITK